MKYDNRIIAKEYDDSLFQVLKGVIDEAKIGSEKSNLDPISIFLYVNEKLEFAYTLLALATGIISDENFYNEFLDSQIISEKLLERIYIYINPIIEEARNDIKSKAEDILESTSLEELQNRYNSLSTILSKRIISQNSYLYEGIEFTKKITL